MRTFILRSLTALVAVAVLDIGFFYLFQFLGAGDETMSALLAVCATAMIFCVLYLLQPGLPTDYGFRRKQAYHSAKEDIERFSTTKVKASSPQSDEFERPATLTETSSLSQDSPLSLEELLRLKQDEEFSQLDGQESDEFPSITDGYQTPQTKKAPSASESTPIPQSNLSAGDLMEEIHRHGFAIARLIRDSGERIKALEKITSDRMHLLDSEKIKATFNAKRIISALETRLDRIKELVETPSMENLIRVRDLIESDLVIPCDAVSALINTEELPSLPADQWKSAIDSFLSPVERAIEELGYKLPKNKFG